MRKAKRFILPVLNLAIVVIGMIGTYIMMTGKGGDGSGLTASGIENLKFYTVLSNLLCTGVAAWGFVHFIRDRKSIVLPRALMLAKLISASAVGLTFLIIAAFLAPLYRELNLYSGSNLYFHLVIPLIAMVEFLMLEGEIPFRYAVISAVPTFLYGMCYLINILVNGVGTWPDGNDWYGFVNWGLPIGLVIFLVITLMSFGIACLLRGLNRLAARLCRQKTL